MVFENNNQNKTPISKMLPARMLLILAVAVCCVLGEQYQDRYYEEAFVKPLASGHINTYFQFTTEWNFENCK